MITPPEEPSDAPAEVRVHPSGAAGGLSPAAIAMMRSALEKAIVPAVRLSNLPGEVHLVGWHGGDGKRPVDELVFLQSDVTTSVRSRPYHVRHRGELQIQLEQDLRNAGHPKPEAAITSASHLSVGTRLDGQDFVSDGLAAAERWVLTATIGDVGILIAGAGVAPATLELSTLTHSEVQLS